MEDPRLRRWRIGELAAATGLTVRTLHHYEQVGLLSPSGRSEGGHRLYGEADIQRLYRIRVLRGLGLSLQDIARSLDEKAALPDVLAQHLARVEEEVARAAGLRDRLRSLTARAGTGVDPSDLLQTIDAMSRLERHVAERRRGTPARERENEARWRELGERLRACMQSGEEPSADGPKALAAVARSLIREFAGRDPVLIGDLARIRAADPPRNLAGWDPPLIRYLDRALAALEETEK